MKSWLEKNAIETYSTHNEGTFVIIERFIRTLKSKIYKCMTSVSENIYIDKLECIVNKYNNTCHSTIKTKHVDIKSSTYIDCSKRNEKDPQFKICDIVRISKYKNIFAKGCTLNWSEEGFVVKKVENTVPWTHIINDINRKEIVGTFYKNCKKKKKKIKKRSELKK